MKIRICSHFCKIFVATAFILAGFLVENEVRGESQLPGGPNWPTFFTNSSGMTFKLINPGSFIMGEDGKGTDTDQYPAHRVDITKRFYMETEEVAPSIYQQSNLSGSPSDISWLNADAFAKWLSKHDKCHYRLPTEAEWNYVYDRGLINLNSREWMNDWHFPYFDDHLIDPTGPSTGLVKVIRDDGTNRHSLPVNATGEKYGFPPTSFRLVLVVEPITNSPWIDPRPFPFAAVIQNNKPALQGPDPKKPYFTVDAALPIPPDDDLSHNGSKAGVDASVYDHNHSPGLAVMPNGDVIAVWFSGPKGNEYEKDVRFVWSRLRYGSLQWDMPTIFFKIKDYNDESPLLWRDTKDKNTVWLIGGNRKTLDDKVAFKVGKTEDNGATWDFRIPESMTTKGEVSGQPITSMFRGPSPAGPDLYFAMDGEGSHSLLWKSSDNGLNWTDTGGRTSSGRHSTIVPLKDGRLLSIGGKNAKIDGKQPECYSSDWGASWSSKKPTPFSPLGSNQRPDLIRLASGRLFYVGDSQPRREDGPGVMVALSSDEGKTWITKQLPVTRPHEKDKNAGTAGYVTAAQGPNGVIHILTTMTKPSLHYELNEAWILSKTAGDMHPDATGGKIKRYTDYSAGKLRAKWSARITSSGCYLLDGEKVTYYPDGKVESRSTYENGRPLEQTCWSPAGIKLWTWTYDNKNDTAVWTKYWANGNKKVVSNWLTNPELKTNQGKRKIYCKIANGISTLFNQDGSIKETNTFNMGCIGDAGSCLSGGWY